MRVVTPFELVSTAPPGSSGILEDGGFIEAGSIRPSFGITLEEATQDLPRNFDAGTVLVGSIFSLDPNITTLPEETDQIIWCEHDESHPMRASMIWCLSDADNDGRMDQYYARRTSTDNALVIDSPATRRGDMAIMPAYRTATQEELPTRRIGYELCTPPSFDDLKFASVIEMNNGHVRTPNSDDCTFGEIMDDALVVDALTLQLQGTGETIRYTIDATNLAEGPAFLEAAGMPFQLADGTATSALIRTFNGFLQQSISTSILAACPLQVTEATHIRDDEIILSIPVQYANTGILRETLSIRNDTLPAGSPMFGIALFSSRLSPLDDSGHAFTWCAPRTTEYTNGAIRVETICISNASRSRPRWIQVSNSDSLLPTRLSYNNMTPSVLSPSVDQDVEPDFGYDLTLKLRIDNIGRNEVELAWELDTGRSATTVFRNVDYNFGDTGEFVIALARFNLKITLARDLENRDSIRVVSIEQTAPIEIGDPVR